MANVKINKKRCQVEERTQDIMKKLQNGIFTPEDFCEATNHVITLAENDRSIKVLEELEGHAIILDVMRSLKTDSHTQKVGCAALSTFMRRSDRLRRLVASSKADSRVVQVIDDFSEDVGTLTAAFETASLLATDERCRKRMLDRTVRESVIQAMDKFKDDVYLQTQACAALAELLRNDINLQLEVLVSVDYRYIVTAIEMHYESLPLLEQAFRALAVLASTVDNATYFHSERVHKVITETLRKIPDAVSVLATGYELLNLLASGSDGIRDEVLASEVFHIVADMRRYHNDVGFQIVACQLITTLAYDCKSQHLLESHESSRVVFNAMHRFPNDAELQIVAFGTLERLGEAILQKESSNEYIQNQDWLCDIHTAMTDHKENADVQEAACRALCKLLQLRPEVIDRIGEDEDADQQPIHLDLFESLMYFETEQHENVQHLAYSAINDIIKRNVEIGVRLIEVGVYVPLLKALETFKKSREVQYMACKVLGRLAEYSQRREKERLSNSSLLLKNISKTFSSYNNDLDIVEEVMKLMACLVVVDEVSSALKEPDTLAAVVECMEWYMQCKVVQQNGLVLLRQWIDKDWLNGGPESRLSLVPRLVFRAMGTFEESYDLQFEAWKTIEVLLELSPEMEKSLHEEASHKKLVENLLKYEEDTQLINLARTCTSQMQDTKDQMLLLKSKGDCLRDVKCLIALGADVNVGSNRNTPLCHACNRNDTEMIRVMLKQKCNHIKTALKICLENQTYDIVGMLLEHIGIEKQAGSISWNGLDLDLLDVRWFDSFPRRNRSGTASGNVTPDTDWVDGPFTPSFASITTLDLSRNGLTQLPDDLAESLPNLEDIDLRGNKFPRLPSCLLRMERLRILDMSSNLIDDRNGLHCEISPSLLQLNLSKNILKSVPKFRTECLPELEILILSENQIDRVRTCPLRKLRMLDLSRNKLQELPEAFLSELPSLGTLDLESNKLKSLPPKAAEKLSSLKTVKLSHNRLATSAPDFLPRFLLNLPNLQILDIRHNGLEGVPPPIAWKTYSLEDIQLSNNNIRQLNISEGIEKWQSLRKLCISYNKLKEVPKELGQITSLTSLDFSCNYSIRKLPDELGTLSNIWELHLDGLKLDIDTILPKDCTAKDKIAFLRGRLKKDVPNTRMKLMIVGLAGRGKTTLRKCLQKKRMSSNNLATVGVEVEEWTKKKGIIDKLSKTGIKHEKYCLSTWDFAGQEDFHSTHPIFLSDRSLYLVVYDLTRGPEEAKTLRPWLLTIHARSPGCPVIIVGTHADKVPEEGKEEYMKEIRKRIMELYASHEFPNINLKGFFEICATSYNEEVKELKRCIFEVIDDYKIGREPVIGQMIPQSYVQLQEIILESAKTKHVLNYNELVGLVCEKGVQLGESELPHAIRFLHQSGILLHYEDPALNLRDVYFIDPQWLCKMMAKIVTVKEINPFIDENGVLKKSHLSILLKDSNFSIEAYQGLMQKFEIAVPKDENELLIPSKMSMERPADIDLDEIDGNGLITRRYKMQYIPIGFWSKAISRLIMFSQTVMEEVKGQLTCHKYWREGMYVRWSQAAFVLLEQISEEPNCIDIIVPHTRQGKRLLGYVVDHVDDIIEEWYPGLAEPLVTGEESIVRSSLCPECQGDETHYFKLEELSRVSHQSDVIVCPGGIKNISLDRIAPDIVLGDLDTLKLDNFHFQPSDDTLLGDGACGKVFKAAYNNQDVAVKVFHTDMMGEFHAHRTLRQEVTVLRRLSHLSIVSVVGVALRPCRVLVMELAPLGSLRKVMEGKKRMSQTLKHRVALQVAEGLEFLHSQRIIYRDLKPENVLMYSLSTVDPVNAKISDYGISGLATPIGLTSSVGTIGYRAPEVAQKDVLYNNKVDIYSLGVMLYELFIDPSAFTLVAQGQLLASLRDIGTKAYPDVHKLILQCIAYLPEDRPSSSDVVRQLQALDSLCLQRVIKVFDDLSLESAAIRKFQDNGVRKTELWFGGGLRAQGQVVWCDVSGEHNTDTAEKIQSGDQSLEEERIMSLVCLGDDTIMLSNAKNKMWALDSQNHNIEFQLPELSDCVPCLQLHDGYCDEGVVFAGLANGQVAIYSVAKIKSGPCQPDEYIRVSENEAVVSMCIGRKKLWIGCGGQVMSLSLDPFVQVLQCEVPKTNMRGMITNIAVGGDQLFIGRRKSPDVEVWNLHDNSGSNALAHTIKCDSIIRTKDDSVSVMNCHVKSMMLQTGEALWIGTESGYVILVDPNTYTVTSVIRRHNGPVKVIMSSDDLEDEQLSSAKESFVVTVGKGYVNQCGKAKENDKNSTYALLWDNYTSGHIRDFAAYNRQRSQTLAPPKK